MSRWAVQMVRGYAIHINEEQPSDNTWNGVQVQEVAMGCHMTKNTLGGVIW